MKTYFFLFALFCIWVVYIVTTKQLAERKVDVECIEIVCPKITPDILQSIPSSLEMLFLLKQIAYQYQDSTLNSVSNPNKYEKASEQALNLGIYNTDLSLANLYQKDQSSLVFFNIVKDLEYKLRIEQFSEYQTTKLDKKEMVLDLVLIQQNFEKINNRLEAQKRESTRILVLAGAWIEAMYLATLAYEQQPNLLLREKIAEQKLNLEQILLVTDVHKTKANFADLILDLKQLHKIYKNIKIIKDPSYTTKMSEQDGLLEFKQIGESCVEMNNTDFENLRKIIKLLRNKIVKN